MISNHKHVNLTIMKACELTKLLCHRTNDTSVLQSTNFCGENGVTYSSLCEWRREQCETNKAIRIVNKGQCSEYHHVAHFLTIFTLSLSRYFYVTL